MTITWYNKLMNATRPVAVSCRLCGDIQTLQLSYDGEKRWRSGELIQDALPELTVDERELLISGTCEKCWNKLFPDSED